MKLNEFQYLFAFKNYGFTFNRRLLVMSAIQKYILKLNMYNEFPSFIILWKVNKAEAILYGTPISGPSIKPNWKYFLYACTVKMVVFGN